MADFKLSEYQEKIQDFFLNHPHDNMLVNALAGSGKSSTACLLLEQVTQPSVYLAFNNSVVEEFKKRIKNPKVKIYTTHSIGYGIMLSNMEEKGTAGGFGKRLSSSVTLDNLKIYKIVEEYLEKYDHAEFMEMLFLKENYVSLYNLARMTMADMSNPDDINRLIKGHGLFVDFEHGYSAPTKEAATKVIQYINKRDWETFENNSVIDFGGMLYITYWKLKRKEWKVPFYDLFFNIVVDEAQDLSLLQQSFLPFLKRKGGRFVLIGDEKQAICAYQGGNSRAYANYYVAFAPIETFDLPICYRCPTSHLTNVNRTFGIPILPRPDAPKGEIIKINKEDICRFAKGGDKIVSRYNRWLAPVILDLATHGIPVCIPDKELVENLKKVVTKRAKKCSSTRALREWFDKDIRKYQERVSKIKNTKLIRYGDENYSNRLKSKETLLKKYGVENVSQIEEVKLKKINTCIKNYGVDNPLKNINIKDKMQNTMLSRYGYTNPSKLYEFQEMKKQTCLDKYGEDNYSKTSSYRKYNEDKGIWIKTSDVKDFILYYRKVWSETRKFKKELFDKWNGKCYYTDQILLTDKKLYNDPLYRTIDHKISIYNGYKNKIDFREIGNISNLCICSRKSNIHKNINNEVDYKIII